MYRQVNLLVAASLLLLQLLLPVFAPQLHQLMECDANCCAVALVSDVAADAAVAQSPTAHLHCGSACPWHDEGEGRDTGTPRPHNCDSCAVCQVLLAPRCAVVVFSLEVYAEQSLLAILPTVAVVPVTPTYLRPARAPPVA